MKIHELANIFGMMCTGSVMLLFLFRREWGFAAWYFSILSFLIYLEFYRRSSIERK